MGTIATTTDEKQDPGMMDHDEIIALTQDVKKFSDSLARLKLLFTDGFGNYTLIISFGFLKFISMHYETY